MESSKIKKNYIFFAIKGEKTDGNKFIPAAIKKGSKIVVSEIKFKEYQDGVLYIKTQNVRKLLAEVAFKIYRKIPKNLIAVTGTNGQNHLLQIFTIKY